MATQAMTVGDAEQVHHEYLAVIDQVRHEIWQRIEYGGTESQFDVQRALEDLGGLLSDWDPMTDEDQRRDLRAYWQWQRVAADDAMVGFWRVTKRGRIRRA